jgi:hypothetical protein
MNEVAQMLATWNEEHRKEMEQLKDGFAKMLAEQQKQMAQFQVPYLGMIRYLMRKQKAIGKNT